MDWGQAALAIHVQRKFRSIMSMTSPATLARQADYQKRNPRSKKGPSKTSENRVVLRDSDREEWHRGAQEGYSGRSKSVHVQYSGQINRASLCQAQRLLGDGYTYLTRKKLKNETHKAKNKIHPSTA